MEVLADGKGWEDGYAETAKHRLPNYLIVVEAQISSHRHHDIPFRRLETPLRVGIGVRIDQAIVARQILRNLREAVFFEVLGSCADDAFDGRNLTRNHVRG